MDEHLTARWFLLLSGDLEHAALAPQRRAFHRSICWATAVAARRLLLTDESPHKLDDAESVPHWQVLDFLRRLRWLVLWQDASDETHVLGSGERARLGLARLTDAMQDIPGNAHLLPGTNERMYPVSPDEMDLVMELFGLLGGAGHYYDTLLDPREDIIEATVDETERAYAMGRRWLSGIPAVEGLATSSALSPALVTRCLRVASKAKPITEAEVGFGLDVVFARAREIGANTYAMCWLYVVEELTYDQIAGLDADCVLSDEAGTTVSADRPGGMPMGPHHQILIPVTQYTAIAIAAARAERTSGPLFMNSGTNERTTARWVEFMIGLAFQEDKPEEE